MNAAPLSFRMPIGSRLIVLRWSIRHRLKRFKRAAAYAVGTLSPEDAQHIIADCERIAKRFALMTLAAEHVMDMAIEAYGDRALHLNAYIADACGYVASKWDVSSDDYWHPRDWALSHARHNAEQDGIKITEQET